MFKLITMFEITVPADYDHATRLDTFRATHQKEFCFYSDAITDVNYAKRATTKLTAGRKFQVKVFGITEQVISEECLVKIKAENGTLVGAQGASLVYEQRKAELPKDKWAISFDEKDALWQDSFGFHRVPRVYAVSVGVFDFVLAYFENDWVSDNVLLCFCDLPALETETLDT